MSTTLFRIQTQYRENVAWSEGGTCWKYKGGVEFELNIPMEWVMYQKDRVEAIIKDMLAEKSDECTIYEFRSMDPVFHKPNQLGDDEFKKRFQMGGK